MSDPGRALRIALATDWYLPRLGGIELHVRDLAAGLRALGHEVPVLTTTPGLTVPRDVRRLDAVRIPIAGVALDPRLVGRVRRLLDEGSIDLLHAHVSVVSPLAYAAVLAARAAGVPCVVTFHSVLHASARVLAWADRLLGWRHWNVVPTAVSRHVARQLERVLPGVEVGVLPNGVDAAAWCAADRPASDGVHIVSAMRLHRKKRPLALLAAFDAARRGMATGAVRLTLYGDGPERPLLEREIALRGLAGLVTLAGASTREELARSYASADLFVLPTRREAFGIAALEARCSGLPVLAMRDSGVTEFLEHARNALLAADDDELAAQLTRLIRDSSLRRRLADAGDDTNRFDWPRVLTCHLRCYERAIGARASSAATAAAPAPLAGGRTI